MAFASRQVARLHVSHVEQVAQHRPSLTQFAIYLAGQNTQDLGEPLGFASFVALQAIPPILQQEAPLMPARGDRRLMPKDR